jgi:hypothetical protein
MDTMGVDDSYGSDDDHHNRYDLAEEDKLSVNLDDIVDDDEDEDDIDLSKSKTDDASENKDREECKEQVTADEEDRPGSQGSGSGSGSDSGQTKSTGSSGGSGENLFAVVESKDKGLADIETGSEVYLSELLVSDCKRGSWLIGFVCRLVSTWRTLTMLRRPMRKTWWIWETNSPK